MSMTELFTPVRWSSTHWKTWQSSFIRRGRTKLQAVVSSLPSTLYNTESQGDARESGETPLLSRNCKRRFYRQHSHCRKGGKALAFSRKSGDRSSCRYDTSLSRKRRPMQIRGLRRTIFFLAIVISFFVARPLTAAESGAIRGTITDPLGAVIRNAQVELFQG